MHNIQVLTNKIQGLTNQVQGLQVHVLTTENGNMRAEFEFQNLFPLIKRDQLSC
jgi:hypothetical protein